MFSREHKPNTPAWKAYHACESRDAKRKFRQDWIGAKYASLVREKKYTKSFQRIDTTRGLP